MKRILMIAVILMLITLTACQTAAQPTVSATEPNGNQTQNPTDAPAPEPTASTGYPQPGVNPNGAPSITEAYPPSPADAEMVEDKFYLDQAELRKNADKADTTDVYVYGNLPTPCNLIRVKVNPPDQNKKIVINLYSVIKEDILCAQQLAPFEGIIASLGGFSSGKYSIFINDQSVGEITIP